MLIVYDSILCMVFPRLARWMVVARLPGGDHPLHHVVFMCHRHARKWIKVEAIPLMDGIYEAVRLK